MYKRGLFSLVSGLIFSLGFAPFDYWPLSIISISFLIYLLKDLSYKETFLIGYIFGFGMWITGISWLYVSIHYHGNIGMIGSSLLILLFIAALSIYSGILFLLNKFFETYCSSSLSLFSLPASWTIIELLRSYLFTGFPWLISGTMLADSWIDGFTPVFGAQGNSFLLILIGSILYRFSFEIHKKRATLPYAFFLSFVFMTSYLLKSIEWTDFSKEISVSIYQPNLTLEDKWSQYGIIKTHNMMEKAILNSNERELIVFPETAMILSEKDNKSFLDAINYKISDKSLTFVTGIVEKEGENRIKNRLITLGSEKNYYDKVKLVPFGEFIPLEAYLGSFLDIIGLNLTNTVAGNAFGLINTGDYLISPSICYEIAFDNFIRRSARESNLLLTVSNDTWFGESFGPIQHLEIAQNRALEHKKPLVRATNSGISAFISKNGEIQKKQGYFEEKRLNNKVKLFKGETFYSKYGNFPLLALILLYVVLIIYRKLCSQKYKLNK